jgi:hypothetical protein
MAPVCSLNLYVSYRLFHVLYNIMCETSVICSHIIVTRDFKQCFYLSTLAKKNIFTNKLKLTTFAVCLISLYKN